MAVRKATPADIAMSNTQAIPFWLQKLKAQETSDARMIALPMKIWRRNPANIMSGLGRFAILKILKSYNRPIIGDYFKYAHCSNNALELVARDLETFDKKMGEDFFTKLNASSYVENNSYINDSYFKYSIHLSAWSFVLNHTLPFI